MTLEPPTRTCCQVVDVAYSPDGRRRMSPSCYAHSWRIPQASRDEDADTGVPAICHEYIRPVSDGEAPSNTSRVRTRYRLVFASGRCGRNCSGWRGSEELSAGGEWVEVLCPPGAEDGRQCHFGL